ncbi:hemolysin family protein [Rhodoligotrophos ferricapiens]|uniref:hemolysin family protein n=1 Tax=Rhodoligotrophos ferricapiens TaxID=3069264 RepID=UPI00315CEF06
MSQIWSRLRQVFRADDPGLGSDIQALLHSHEASGAASAASPEARSMLLKILEFGELRVDDVMVSRADIVAINEKAKLNEALLLFADATHSRIPVYRETLDEPVGMLHIKDLIGWIISHGMAGRPLPERTPDGDISAIVAAAPALSLAAVPLDTEVRHTGCLRDVLFVPPSMPAADLLVKMQATRSHMALVVDEYGGTAGLVTIEDIVEEIVGDIDDEHDEEDAMIRQDVDGSYIADARTAIEDVEGLLNVDLLPDDEDEDVDTLSGLLFSLVDRVPARGETIAHPSGIVFEVLDSDPRRLKTIKIIPNAELRASNGNGHFTQQ